MNTPRQKETQLLTLITVQNRGEPQGGPYPGAQRHSWSREWKPQATLLTSPPTLSAQRLPSSVLRFMDVAGVPCRSRTRQGSLCLCGLDQEMGPTHPGQRQEGVSGPPWDPGQGCGRGGRPSPDRWCPAWPRVQAMWSPRRRARPAGGMGCSLAGSEGSSWGGQTLPVRSGGGGQPQIPLASLRLPEELERLGRASLSRSSFCLSVCLCRAVLWPGLKVSAPPWVGCRGSL